MPKYYPEYSKAPICAIIIAILLFWAFRNGVIQMLLAVFLDIPPKACCSCACKAPDGQGCSDSIEGSYVTADCERICAKACASRECDVEDARKIPQDACTEFISPL